MATYVKRGLAGEAKAETDRKLRETVEIALANIARRGDAAVRDMSIRFDQWDRKDFRPTQAEIDAWVAGLSAQQRKDIEFAQEQVRNFATIKRKSMTDVEVETLPGVVLGHNVGWEASPATANRPIYASGGMVAERWTSLVRRNRPN